jgi:hypothetical protein
LGEVGCLKGWGRHMLKLTEIFECKNRVVSQFEI